MVESEVMTIDELREALKHLGPKAMKAAREMIMALDHLEGLPSVAIIMAIGVAVGCMLQAADLDEVALEQVGGIAAGVMSGELLRPEA